MSDLVIQATPVGMKPSDDPILKADAFRAGQYVYDLIYMYPETGLMKEASSAGAKVPATNAARVAPILTSLHGGLPAAANGRNIA